jgi:hypothetical protein
MMCPKYNAARRRLASKARAARHIRTLLQPEPHLLLLAGYLHDGTFRDIRMLGTTIGRQWRQDKTQALNRPHERHGLLNQPTIEGLQPRENSGQTRVLQRQRQAQV